MDLVEGVVASCELELALKVAATYTELVLVNDSGFTTTELGTLEVESEESAVSVYTLNESLDSGKCGMDDDDAVRLLSIIAEVVAREGVEEDGSEWCEGEL